VKVVCFGLENHRTVIGGRTWGTNNYEPSIKYTAAPGIYTIIKTLPVESEANQPKIFE